MNKLDKRMANTKNLKQQSIKAQTNYTLDSNPKPSMMTPRVLGERRIGPHDISILELLVGTLLGNGSLELQSTAKVEYVTPNATNPEGKIQEIKVCNLAFSQEKPNGEYLL